MKPNSPATGGVHFDIGRVTLHGYSTAQQTRFVGALQTHLTGQVTNSEQNCLVDQQIAHIDGGALPAGMTPEQAAERIAASIVSTATQRQERNE